MSRIEQDAVARARRAATTRSIETLAEELRSTWRIIYDRDLCVGEIPVNLRQSYGI